MILDETVKINVSYGNIGKLKNQGFDVKMNDIIDLPISHLSKGSGIKINVKCDICGDEKYVIYNSYIKNYKKYNLYTCLKCCSLKRKKTCFEKYGVDSFSKTEECKEKTRETCLEKYGVDTPLKSDDIKIKIKETLFENYGVDNPSQSGEIKDRKKETMFKNYGVEHAFHSLEIKQKVDNTIYEKYGVTNISKNEDIKIKKIQTCLNNHGVEFYVQSNDHKINMGFILLEDREDYDLYRKTVVNLTYRIKKQLFNNWDGYDYYDGEYIKDNIKLNHNNSKYPTIDHKISVYHGFVNNIDPIEISNIENLCITKKGINCKKNKLIEEKFVKK